MIGLSDGYTYKTWCPLHYYILTITRVVFSERRSPVIGEGRLCLRLSFSLWDIYYPIFEPTGGVDYLHRSIHRKASCVHGYPSLFWDIILFSSQRVALSTCIARAVDYGSVPWITTVGYGLRQWAVEYSSSSRGLRLKQWAAEYGKSWLWVAMDYTVSRGLRQLAMDYGTEPWYTAVSREPWNKEVSRGLHFAVDYGS